MPYAPPEYSQPGSSQNYNPVIAAPAPQITDNLLLSYNITPQFAAPQVGFSLFLNP